MTERQCYRAIYGDMIQYVEFYRNQFVRNFYLYYPGGI